MSPAPSIREYDIIVLGATGFTGTLIVEHIVQQLNVNLRWAIVGRSQTKLEKLANKVKELNAERSQPETHIISSNKEVSEVISKAKVCISLIGPYSKYGEDIIRACVEQKTHYLDACGDVPFLSDMIEKYHDKAKANGVIAVSMVGSFGATQDILARTTIQELGDDCEELILGCNKCFGPPSRGTLNSLMESPRTGPVDPWVLSPVKGLIKPTNFYRHDKDLGDLCASTLSAVQCRALILRAWGLTQSYGPSFYYNEYQRTTWLSGYLSTLWLSFQLALLSSPLKVVVRRFFPEGSGPDESGNDIDIEAVAVGALHRAHGHLTYPSGPYNLSGALLAQAAATILEDSSQYTGMITPSMLGDGYIRRLDSVNVKILTKKLS